ncbi:MAG: OmpA family protein [Caulobacter sp.]|nr:OmpA family protein [Caulobacter sp.]
MTWFPMVLLSAMMVGLTAPPVAAQATTESAEQVWAVWSVYFEPGSAEITPVSAERLDQIAGASRAQAGRGLSIIGHADPLTEADVAEALSQQRAESVRIHLIALGIDPAMLTARGAGDRYPLTTDGSDAAMNRRVQIESQ